MLPDEEQVRKNFEWCVQAVPIAERASGISTREGFIEWCPCIAELSGPAWDKYHEGNKA